MEKIMQITEKINQSTITSLQLQIAILSSAIERRYRRINFLIFLPAVECIVSVLENLGSTIREYAQVDSLKPEHIEHLYNEGFSFSHIALWVGQGLRSLIEEEAQTRFKAQNKDGECVSGSGLYLPFTKDFGQLRLDTPIVSYPAKSENSSPYSIWVQSRYRGGKGCRRWEFDGGNSYGCDRWN
jgi:hypothetical protein